MKTQTPLHLKLALPLVAILAGQLDPAQAAEFCSDEYYIDVTLPNQARWDMCWEHREREGIVLHKVHYTPPSGQRLQVLGLAAVAQIHVPYDDNGARYHDVSDYGLGGGYMAPLTEAECPGGKLLKYGRYNLVCQQTQVDSAGFAYEEDRLHGHSLSLFSVSMIGAYNYIPMWRFLEDGSIEASMGATGALQRYGDGSMESQGWLIADNKTGLSHSHNFFWKLDFDLGGASTDDYIEELNFTPTGNGQLRRDTQLIAAEAGRTVSPEQLRRWRVVDGVLKNAKGLPLSYEVRLYQADQREVGPANESFTHNDIYFTKHNPCELFASHNPQTEGCASNLSEFANNESLAGQDIVVWPSVTFYHVPRAEDSPRMDTHWSHLSLVPRDWLDRNPLSQSADTTEEPDDGNDDNGNDDNGNDDNGNDDSGNDDNGNDDNGNDDNGNDDNGNDDNGNDDNGNDDNGNDDNGNDDNGNDTDPSDPNWDFTWRPSRSGGGSVDLWLAILLAGLGGIRWIGRRKP